MGSKLVWGGSATFLAQLAAGLILSLAASGLPTFIFERTASPGSVLTNGELLLLVCLCSLGATMLVWAPLTSLTGGHGSWDLGAARV